jgi:rare lipoprotein A
LLADGAWASSDTSVSPKAGNSSPDKVKSKGSFSGNVSWYGERFHGRRTASGERFDLRKLTAAHRRLPFFSKVLVENPKTGRACIVKINDRGPFIKNRVLDLSKEGMHKVAPLMPGIIYADCLVLEDD